MKKAICMIALAAVSFGSVYAHGPVVKTGHETTMADTTKKKMKKMKKMKKDTTMKKDTMKMR